MLGKGAGLFQTGWGTSWACRGHNFPIQTHKFPTSYHAAILVGMCYHTPHILSLIISYLVSICPSPLALRHYRKPFSRAPKRNADPIEPARELKSFESPFESLGPFFFLRRLLSLVWSLLFFPEFLFLYSRLVCCSVRLLATNVDLIVSWFRQYNFCRSVEWSIHWLLLVKNYSYVLSVYTGYCSYVLWFHNEFSSFNC